MEQAEKQERLLESSAKELEKRKKKESMLRQQLQQKEVEKMDMEEKYATLQEEATGKTRILKEVWKQFQQTKEEVSVHNLLYRFCLEQWTLWGGLSDCRYEGRGSA